MAHMEKVEFVAEYEENVPWVFSITDAAVPAEKKKTQNVRSIS